MKALTFLVILFLANGIGCLVFFRFQTLNCECSGKSFNFSICKIQTYNKKIFTTNFIVNKYKKFGNDFLVSFKNDALNN
jgi:hypothetical protein